MQDDKEEVLTGPELKAEQTRVGVHRVNFRGDRYRLKDGRIYTHVGQGRWVRSKSAEESWSRGYTF